MSIVHIFCGFETSGRLSGLGEWRGAALIGYHTVRVLVRIVSLAGRRLRDLGELGVGFSRGSERRNEDFILNV